jgi:ribosome biogenesis GTPase A
MGVKVLFISALDKDGINMIRREMGAAMGNNKGVTVGIVGYPNVGKSTLINALAGRGRGRVATSRKAGLTRGITKVKITDDIYLLDSPGIIPFKQDEFDLFLVDSKNPNQLKEPETAAVKLIQLLGKETVGKYYKIDDAIIEKVDEEELLEEIAKKRNILQKGGTGDVGQAARDVLERYQKHELG